MRYFNIEELIKATPKWAKLSVEQRRELLDDFEYCDKCEFEITEVDERHLIDRSGSCNPNMYDSPIILCQNCCNCCKGEDWVYLKEESK